MKIHYTNYHESANTGPNNFMRGLKKGLEEKGFETTKLIDHCDLDFVVIQSPFQKTRPQLLRLDGVYFNPFDDFQKKNELIFRTYAQSESVVFQTDFNKKLTEHMFGRHHNSFVIRNATPHQETDEALLSQIRDFFSPYVKPNTKVWLCASSWRPHKRLSENARYFLQNKEKDDILIVAGEPDNTAFYVDKDPSILCLGNVTNTVLQHLYKISDFFIHLAYLDHCPNVVADAQRENVFTICASSGGTKEIIHRGRIIIENEEWDYSPHDYTRPPALDLSNFTEISQERSITFEDTLKKYIEVINQYR